MTHQLGQKIEDICRVQVRHIDGLNDGGTLFTVSKIVYGVLEGGYGVRTLFDPVSSINPSLPRGAIPQQGECRSSCVTDTSTIRAVNGKPRT
jgi:hypothetical protein